MRRDRVAWGWRLAAAWLLALACGCATVQRAREAQSGSQRAPGERTVKAAEVGLGADTVLTLEAAIHIGLTYHPSMALATQELAAASAQVRQALAGSRPVVQGGLDYSRATANSAGRPASWDLQGRYGASTDLSLLLYDFGKTPAAIRQAYAAEAAAAAGLRAARVTVAYDVRNAFLGLGKAEELCAVAEESVRQFRQHLEQVRAFVAVGRRTRYDVTKSEVDLGNAELELIGARNDANTARAGLWRSLGLAEDPASRVATPPLPAFERSAASLLAAGRARHPDLVALRAEWAGASAAVDAAIAGLFPELSLQAQYGAGGGAWPLLWNISGALRGAWQMFSGGRLTARIDESVARLRAARARLTAREQQLWQEVSRGLSRLDGARQRVKLAALIVRQAAESLSLIEERYRLGGASAIEVTDAQVALTRARADEVKARFDLHLAVAEITFAVGEE